MCHVSKLHCVKGVRIWSFSAPYSPAFGLNTERYRVSLRIQSEYGKMRTRKTPNMDTFHAMLRLKEELFWESIWEAYLKLVWSFCIKLCRTAHISNTYYFILYFVHKILFLRMSKCITFKTCQNELARNFLPTCQCSSF